PSQHGAQCRPCSGGTPYFKSISLSFQALAQHFAVTADRLGFFANTPFRWLLVRAAQLHLAARALTLHLFLQYPERRVYIVVANKDFLSPPPRKPTRPPVPPDTMGAALRPTPAS